MKKILALFDSDGVYGARLMEYIKNLAWEDFDILLFTRQESLTDFLKYQPVEILLYDKDACNDTFYKELQKENIKYIFYLCNDRKLLQDGQEIYKYQAAGKIASDILSCYTKLENNNKETYYDDVQIISVYSPVPGGEKISFAWSLAKELSNKRKVLFIFLDPLPADFIIKSGQTGYAISEYLYYLKENNPANLKSYLGYSEKLSFLSGLSHGFDLLSLSKEDAQKFLKELKDHKDYETVVFYLGFYTEATMEILQAGNQAYLVICKSPYEEAVIKEWERQMELMGIAQDNLRYEKIIIPAMEKTAGQNNFPDQIHAAIRPFAKELADRLLHKERSSYELVERKASAGSY